MSPLPDAPWVEVSADFALLSGNEYLLVVSLCSVVEILSSLSSKSVIPVIDKIFSEFGVPRVFKTDNGSPFNSTELRRVQF